MLSKNSIAIMKPFYEILIVCLFGYEVLLVTIWKARNFQNIDDAGKKTVKKILFWPSRGGQSWWHKGTT